MNIVCGFGRINSFAVQTSSLFEREKVQKVAVFIVYLWIYHHFYDHKLLNKQNFDDVFDEHYYE